MNLQKIKADIYALRLKHKKGRLTTGVLLQSITALILLAILFEVYAVLVPTVQQSGDALNATGVPFGSFFASNGIVFLIIMAALLIAVIFAFIGGLKGGK